MGIRDGSANKKGNNRIGDEHNVPHQTQEDLAEQLRMSTLQLRRYKKLLDLVPELQTAVEEGKISVIIGVAPRKRGRLFRGASNVTAQIIDNVFICSMRTITRNEKRLQL